MRGIFYTISLLLLLAPVLGLVYYYSIAAAQSESAASEPAMVLQAGKLVRSLESDFDRALFISAKTAVLSASEKVLSEGVPLADADGALVSLAVDGRFPGDNQTYPTSEYNYLSRWAAEMGDRSAFYGYNVSLTVQAAGVSVVMPDPYTLLFTANLTVRASQVRTSSFSLTRSSIHQARVRLDGFEDPLYGLKTLGLAPRVFSFNSSAVSGVAAVDQAIASKLYMPSALGPDFLARLEGRIDASPSGLETFVDANELVAQELPVYNRSMIDHIYFNMSAPEGYAWPINGSSHQNFIMDCASASRYGVSDKVDGCG